MDKQVLVACGYDPDAQEWVLGLRGRGGETELQLAQPIVSALVYAAVGFPRAPSASGRARSARLLQA